MVSVVQREWAGKNPRATLRAPITIEDVLNSRMIAYPFRLLRCCLVTDRGGALILVAAERARDFPQGLPLAVNGRHRRECYGVGGMLRCRRSSSSRPSRSQKGHGLDIRPGRNLTSRHW
jgi:acetyl-CoA acetyltransferase